MGVYVDDSHISWRGKRWSWALVWLPFVVMAVGLFDQIPVRVFLYMPTKETHQASANSFRSDRVKLNDDYISHNPFFIYVRNYYCHLYTC